MDSFSKFLERAFEYLNALQGRLSLRWREHANRRSIIVLVCAGLLVGLAYVYLIQPPEEFPAGDLVSVDSGQSLKAIAQILYNEHVIRSPLIFQALVTIFGRERGAHAGDYLFKEPENIWSVARAISIGAYGLEPTRIRVPEGATTKEMSIIFSAHLQRFRAEAFLTQATPQEGYLFPDTYFFLPNATEDTVIQTLRQNFTDQMKQIEPQIASSTHSLSDIIIMASIIEREARNSADRRLISGVLWNRIRRDMPLQVDVTFLYTIGKGTFDLTIKDLTSDSPYNTYVRKGLPPTAIGSPSLDSILAALNPTKTSYLYYLADKNGVTHFSKTYQEHLRKKKLYLGT
ncbi:endolytic transglycosylase MltG [Candidatus Kaiserbacteria bacterium]|nr:endolytic transglycosylase MltG [Candidatus Kaiserbacteria bacterium]